MRRHEDDVFEPIAGLKEHSEAAPIVDLVDLVIKSAIKSAASDIHIEPMEKGVLVRHRLDGLLKEVMDLPKWVHEGLIARMKIMAGMDIAEKRLPQDGRIRVTGEDGREVDFRASTLRTLHGEKMVLRMLDHRKGVPALEELGFSTAISRGAARIPAPSARHDPRRRSDGQRQDDHAVFGARLDSVGAHQHHHRRRSDRVPVTRDQPDADPGKDQTDVREPRCDPFCGRIPTSFSSARSATRRRRGSRCRRRRRATSCCRRFIPTMHRRR